MCGIVGIIGTGNATPALIGGLEKLEYRGYDSAGIFVANHQTDYLIKSSGKIQNLKDKVTPIVKGHIGIGHTRWATHGKPSEKNAHPHVSQNDRFVLVHNGVIENFEELHQTYLTGHTFLGETDTEIVVHLIEVFMEDQETVAEAFVQTLQTIKGSYAFALIDKLNPDTLYAAKNKSPLLIGLGDGFNVVTSDAMAMLNFTKEFVEIEDQEMVYLTKDTVVIQKLDGRSVTRSSYEAQIDTEDVEKGTYPYYMLKEIDEQPAVLRRIAAHYFTEEGINVDSKLLDQLIITDRLYIIACGTSYHAGLASKDTLEKLTGIPVEVHLASEFGYHTPLLSKHPFFIFLSQSGETADSRQVLVKVRELGHPSLTITNVPGSTLSREANFTLLLYAGPEIAVASTKAYTAQLAVLALLAKAVGDAKENAPAVGFELSHELAVIAAAMETILSQKEELEKIVSEYFQDSRSAFYIGRGTDYFVSLEAALKLKEISYIQAEGFAAGELKHGTIALIEEGIPVVGIISDQLSGPHTRGNLKEVESRGANILVIATETMAKESDQLILPDTHPLLTSLTTVVPTQLLAYYAALGRGFDVDKPRNLAKSVTVE